MGYDLSTKSARYLLLAMRDLFAERPEYRSILSLELAGYVPEDHQELVIKLGLEDSVQFHGYLPHREAITLMGTVDVAFLPMVTDIDGRRSYNLSGKIYEYMALRKPILAAVPEGDAADMVRRARIGWVVDPYDVRGMKELVKQLIEKKRNGGLSVHPDCEYIRGFNRRSQGRQLAAVFDGVLQRGG